MILQSQDKAKAMATEFKTFISKGDVVNLAVAVLISTAFNAIVNSLGKDIIMPWVTLLLGKESMNSLVWIIREPYINEAGTEVAALTVNWGIFLQYIVNFFFVAIVAFTVLKIITAARKAAKKAQVTLRYRIRKLFFRKKVLAEEAAAAAEAARLAAEAEAKKAEEEAAAALAAANSAEALLKEIRDLLRQTLESKDASEQPS